MSPMHFLIATLLLSSPLIAKGQAPLSPEILLPPEGSDFPRGDTVADFNEDGFLDLARHYQLNAANGPSMIQVTFGGSTVSSIEFLSDAGNDNVTGLATGDFNEDGHLDLAVTGPGGGLFLGDGAGGFPVATHFPTPYGFGWVSSGDFDNDGHVDLAIAEGVLLGDGTGSFSLLPVSTGPVVGLRDSGDLNGDGIPDLVVRLQDELSILLGPVSPTGFASVTTLAIANGYGAKVFDLDADGDLDIVASPSLLFGDGSGGFTFGPVVGGAASSEHVIPGDVDGDGIADLVGAGVIYYGSPTGSYSLETYPLPSQWWFWQVVDLDGNGRAEIAHTSAIYWSPGPFRRGDANDDGQTDLADIVTIALGLFGGPLATCPAASDTNGDGTVDLADAVSVVEYLFAGGPPPAAPGPIDCGLGIDLLLARHCAPSACP